MSPIIPRNFDDPSLFRSSLLTTAVCITISYTGLFSLFPVPCSLFPKNPELCT
ncbi:hypothetical protein BJP36_43820 [Moorena producens JHB]|uniref:Uncharacterized protein n=1 Tax=Moorena producens (strain JHB) TaxID=1454205 RepID=A0A9Q9UVX4_MOOP1|nr:hypothetical protein BJP36_43820 [Moorena producens JHB]